MQALVQLPQGTTRNATLISTITPALRYNRAVISFLPSTITSSFAVGGQGTPRDIDGDGFTDSMVFSLGDVVNTPDGVLNGPNDAVLVEIDVVVVNGSTSALLEAGLQFYYGASHQIIPAPVTLNPAVADLTWSATYNISTGDAGDIVHGSLTISHSANSSSPAFNVDVVSHLAPYLTLLEGSLSSSHPNATLSVDDYVLAQIPLIEMGSTVFINFTFVLDISVVSGSYVPANFSGSFATAPVNGSVVTMPLSVYNISIPLLSSKLSLGYKSNPGSNDTISVGEYFAYHVTIRLPEGTTLNPTEVVTVPPHLEDTLTLLNVTVHSVGELVSYNNPVWSVSSSVLSTTSNDTAIVTFDSFINAPDQDPANDFIVLAFYGVVLPTADLANGLQVSSQLSYFNGTHTILEADQSRNETVVNPNLNMTQTCIANSSVIQSGTTFLCSLTVFPFESLVTAYNVTIGNALSDFSVVVDGSVSSNYGYAAYYSNTFEVIVSIYNPIFYYNITVNYTAVLTDNVESGANISLPSVTKYLSSPSTFGTSFQFLAEVPITIALPLSSISVNSTSLSTVPTTNVSVGEVVSLFYNIDLIQGMIPSASLVASVPSGLSMLSAKVVSVGNSDGCTILSNGDVGVVTDEDGDGKDDTARFVFGDLCNPADDVVDSDDRVVIEVTALVEDIPSNIAGALLIANGSLSFTNYTLSSNITLAVAEPVLAWSIEWSTIYADAGDLVTGTVVLQHSQNSTAAAYSTDVIALLAPFLELVHNSVAANTSVSLSIADVPQTWDGISSIHTIPLGSSVQLNFTTSLTNAVIAGTSIAVSIAGNYSSAPSLGRLASLPVLNTTLVVSPFPSSNLSEGASTNAETRDGYITIGEIVESHVVITIPEGHTLAPSVHFTLSNFSGVTILGVQALHHSGIEVTNYNLTVFASSDLLTNDSAIFKFDSVLNLPDGNVSNDIIVLAITWVVMPNTTLTDGTVIEATSQFTYSNGSAELVEAIQSNSFVLLKSDAQISQECVPQISAIQAGTTFICNITLFALNSTAPAYNVAIKNNWSIYTSLVSGSATTSNGTIEDDGDEFIALIPVFDPSIKTNVTIQYTVVLTNEVISGLHMPVHATLSFISSPTIYGLVTEHRDNTSVLVDSPVVEMIVNSTSLQLAGPYANVSVGEQISMVYTISMVQGRTQDAVLSSSISPGLYVVSAWVLSLGNSAGCGNLQVGSIGNMSDIDGDGFNETMAFDFGLICNDADGIENAGDMVVVEAIIAVLDVPSNQPQSNVTISGYFEFSNQSVTFDNATLQIVQPDLVFNITSNSTTVQAGSVIEFTIVSNHTQNSTAAAYDFNLVVSPSPYIEFLTTCNPSTSLINATFGNMSVSVPVQSYNTSVQYTLCALVLPSAPTSSVFNLTFDVEYFTAPTSYFPAPRRFNSTFGVSHFTLDPAHTFEVAFTSNFPNKTGNQNVSVGDTITFNSTLFIPGGTTHYPSFLLSLATEGVVLELVEVNVVNFTTELIDINLDGRNESFAILLPEEMTYATEQLVKIETKAIVVSMKDILEPPMVVNVSQYWRNTGSEANFTSQVQLQLFVNPLPIPTTYYFTTWKNAPITFDVITGNTSPYQDTPDLVVSFTQAFDGDVIIANTTIFNFSMAATPFTYSPSLNYVGLDNFNYTVQNSINGVGVGAVYIQVDYKNYPPIPLPDNITIYENTLVEIYVLDNDFDVVC